MSELTNTRPLTDLIGFTTDIVDIWRWWWWWRGLSTALTSLGSKGWSILLYLGFNLDLFLGSFVLPLIDNNCVDVFIVIVILILRCFVGVKENLDLLLHLIAGNTVSIEKLVEVRDNKSFDMEVGPCPAILDTLDCSGNTAKYPHLVSSKEKFLALKICHLQTQRLYKVVVEE